LCYCYADITPSSWRIGAAVVRKRLGPAKRSLQTFASSADVSKLTSDQVTQPDNCTNIEDRELASHSVVQDNHQSHPVSRYKHDVVSSKMYAVEKPKSCVVAADKRKVITPETNIPDRQPRSVGINKFATSQIKENKFDLKGIDVKQLGTVEIIVAKCVDIGQGESQVNRSNASNDVDEVIPSYTQHSLSDLGTSEQHLVIDSEKSLHMEDKDQAPGI